MAKRYFESTATIEEKTIKVFVCQECGFEFNAVHEMDDKTGGWECLACELDNSEVENHELKKRIDKVINNIGKNASPAWVVRTLKGEEGY